MKNYLSLIKFSHTIFALPFAIVGFFLGSLHQGALNLSVFVLIILCMVFARSAAMAFNRYIDRDIDAQNERTAGREIPAGIISSKNALLFVCINSAGLILCSYGINRLCFYLSPVALIITLGYSYTKRFTSLCHLVLGLGLALAPVGAYIAVTAQFHVIPILYGLAVIFWVAGFDIIYALQDIDFDRKHQLNSIPARFGILKSLRISRFLHFLVVLCMLFAAYRLFSQNLGMQYALLTGTLLFILVLFRQHLLVNQNDLSRINLAFFTTNGLASLIFGSFFALDYFV